MKTVTIKRSQWGKGALLNEDDGKMCCLGFCAIAGGLTKSQITDESFLHELTYELKGLQKLQVNEQLQDILADINDALLDSNGVGVYKEIVGGEGLLVIKHIKSFAHQEALIRQYGRKAGVQFRFVN